MDPIDHADADPERPSSPSGIDGSFAAVRPFDELIDFSEPVAFEDTFPIPGGGSSEKTTELRVGEAEDYLFVRVRCAGTMVEVSSGLRYDGVCCETWHGVSSGESVKGRLQLRCALKFDGATFKLDMRVREEDIEGDTLIYGCSRFEGSAFGPQARVGLHELDGEEAPAASSVRSRARGVRKTENGVSRAEGNGNGSGCACGNGSAGGNGNGATRRPAQPIPSPVRFCESDQWFEYEAPRLS